MTYQELKERWDRGADLRVEWNKILNSKSWRHVSAMIREKAVEEAEAFLRVEADPVLARNLSKQKGARWAITELQNACIKQEAPVGEGILEEYAHITPKERT